MTGTWILLLVLLGSFLMPMLAPGWRALALIGGTMVLMLLWGWGSVLSQAEYADQGFGPAVAVGFLFVLSSAALAGLLTRGAQIAFGLGRANWLTALGAVAALAPSAFLAVN